ncbi:fimbrillin family protein [Bacteroides fragilis]
MYKSSGWGDAYPRYDAQNNKSTRQANGWSQASPVYLLVDKATIWAYYPYNQAVTDGTKIPVPINVGTSVDYMWGKSTNQVSVIETDARIPMKHALSQFVVRLKVSPEYHNDGNLTSAKLKATGAKFATTGTMNLNDGGKITFQPTSTELTWSPNTTVPAQGQQAVDYAAAIYPMTLGAGEVSLEVVIDGATYTYAIPQITWEAGKRYIYSITMRSNDAEIGGENGQSVTIEGWTSTEEDITLVPVK